MNGFLILGAVLLVLLLLAQVRVGGQAQYDASGAVVRLKIGPIRLTLYPMRPRKEKPERGKKRNKPKPEEAPAPRAEGGGLDLLRQFLPLMAEAAGRLKRKIRIDRLNLDLTVAAPDPAFAAMAYGGANAALGMFIALLENNFNVKERRIRTAVDFNRTSPAAALDAAFSLTIGQGFALAAILGWKALRILLSNRTGKVQKQKEAV